MTLDASRLREWLGAETLIVDGRPTSGGWSNETIFIRADGRPLVVRMSPTGPAMFPSYDLSIQVRCLELGATAGLPVPALVSWQPDPSTLGQPFFVMEHLVGRVPADSDPPFTKAGFVFDATDEQREHLCRQAVHAIAAVHAVAPPEFLPVGPDIRSHVDSTARLQHWADIHHSDVVRAHARLVADSPDDDTPIGLLWGDARPANMVINDTFDVVGLLDWELAASGPGEFDLAWFLEMNRMRSVGAGIASLPGFLSDDATWACWADAIGRTPRHIEWHRLYAAYRVAVLFFLNLRSAVGQGSLRAQHRVFTDNLATRRLRELLDR